MTDDRDEITLKEAAEYVKRDLDVPAEARAREVGNASATLEAMLAASRRNQTVRKRVRP